MSIFHKYKYFSSKLRQQFQLQNEWKIKTKNSAGQCPAEFFVSSLREIFNIIFLQLQFSKLLLSKYNRSNKLCFMLNYFYPYFDGVPNLNYIVSGTQIASRRPLAPPRRISMPLRYRSEKHTFFVCLSFHNPSTASRIAYVLIQARQHTCSVAKHKSRELSLLARQSGALPKRNVPFSIMSVQCRVLAHKVCETWATSSATLIILTFSEKRFSSSIFFHSRWSPSIPISFFPPASPSPLPLSGRFSPTTLPLPTPHSSTCVVPR